MITCVFIALLINIVQHFLVAKWLKNASWSSVRTLITRRYPMANAVLLNDACMWLTTVIQISNFFKRIAYKDFFRIHTTFARLYLDQNLISTTRILLRLLNKYMYFCTKHFGCLSEIVRALYIRTVFKLCREIVKPLWAFIGKLKNTSWGRGAGLWKAKPVKMCENGICFISTLYRLLTKFFIH